MKKFKLSKIVFALCIVCMIATVFVACDKEEPTYTVELKFTSSYGSVSLDKDVYHSGDEVSVKITPKITSEVNKLIVNGKDVTSEISASGGTYKFTIEDNSTVEVEFKQVKWSVSVKSYDEAKGNVEVEGDVKAITKGESITINVEPKEGYQINQVMINNQDKTSEVKKAYGVYTFSVTQNTVIEVKFGVKNRWILRVPNVPSYKGSLTVAPDYVDFPKNQEVTLTVTEAEGWELTSFVVGEEELIDELEWTEGEGSYTFNIQDDTEVEIVYTPTVTYNLTVSGLPEDEGIATVNYNESEIGYGPNEPVTFVVDVDDDYELASFRVNGQEVANAFTKRGGEYSVIMTEDTTVEFEFDEAARHVEATVATFDDAINKSGRIIVDFWGSACSPCVNILAPQLKQLIIDFEAGVPALQDLNVRVVKVRVSSSSSVNESRTPEAAIYDRYKSYHTKGGLPFMIMLENGVVIGTFHGCYEGSSYDYIVNWLRAPAFE